MKNKHSSMEDVVQQLIQEEFDNAKVPTKTKAETWEEINNQLNDSDVRQRRSWKKSVVIVAAAFLIAICFGFSQTRDTKAFEWLTSLFIHVDENNTSVTGSIGTPPRAEDAPPIPSEEDFEIIEVATRVEKMDISEAQDITNFEILVPDEIPDSFEEPQVNVYFANDKVDNRIELLYSHNEFTFQIIQEFVTGQMGYGITVDPDDTSVREVMIKGKKGVLFSFKNGEKKLTLDYQNYHIELNGRLPDEEMVDIAMSLVK